MSIIIFQYQFSLVGLRGERSDYSHYTLAQSQWRGVLPQWLHVGCYFTYSILKWHWLDWVIRTFIIQVPIPFSPEFDSNLSNGDHSHLILSKQSSARDFFIPMYRSITGDHPSRHRRMIDWLIQFVTSAFLHFETIFEDKRDEVTRLLRFISDEK